MSIYKCSIGLSMIPSLFQTELFNGEDVHEKSFQATKGRHSKDPTARNGAEKELGKVLQIIGFKIVFLQVSCHLFLKYS